MDGRGDIDRSETHEWLEALDDVVATRGEERARFLLGELADRAFRRGVPLPAPVSPYVNTIPLVEQPPYPGDREIERRIKSIIRWNAMAMVVRANKHEAGIGGHISTYASAATLLRGRLQPLLPRPGRAGLRRRPGLLPGPRLAGHLRARLSRRPAHRGAARELPPRARAGRRALLVSAPLADAGLLGVPHGLDGPGPDHGDLPGAVQPLPGGSRPRGRPAIAGSGPSSATARPTSRRRSARSRWPPARSSTT